MRVTLLFGLLLMTVFIHAQPVQQLMQKVMLLFYTV